MIMILADYFSNPRCAQVVPLHPHTFKQELDEGIFGRYDVR